MANTAATLSGLLREGVSDRDFLESLKEFLAATREAARADRREPFPGGLRGCRRYSDAMDAVLEALYARARRRYLESKPVLNYRLAAVAVGGYGRHELCPRSDVDLLFLHPYKVDPYVEAMTESVLYGLWDLGLDVGHSVRSVKEALRWATEDDTIRTGLLDYRFVAGDADFLRESAAELDRFLYFSEADRFIEKKIQELSARHARSGNTVFVLEPNIKEGVGGLRDLHTALWAARIKYKCAGLIELKNKGVLGGTAFTAYRQAQDYLLRVRSDLHALTGKKIDVLSFEVQEAMADLHGFRTHERIFAVERFMRSYYMHAASAANFAAELVEEVERLLPDRSRSRFRIFARRTVGANTILYRGKLDVRNAAALQKEPLRIFEYFRSLQKSKAAMSRQAKRSIQRALPAVGAAFREEPRAAKLFLEILADPVRLRETLLAMNECRLLGRYVPEFAPLSCKVLHDIYHVYTVDIHSIIAASTLAGLETAPARSREEEAFLSLYRALPRRELLTLAILFHDIGKGRGHGHSKIGAEIVGRVAERMGLAAEERADLVFLVEQHLTMAHVSQRRDLHDLEMILKFSETVGSMSRLDQLYLLTYADLKAVGPDVWNQWKAMLLAELYEKTRNILQHGPLKRPFEERARRRRQEVRELLADFPADEVGWFLNRFVDRYFLGTPDARFATHLRMLTGYDGGAPRIEVVDSPASGTSEIIIVCRDRHALFATIAGTLSANMVNILNASIATSLDGIAVDTFYVTYRGTALGDDPKKERLVFDLAAVLEGRADAASLIEERRPAPFAREKVVTRYRPTRVVFDNGSSTRYTVIDVFTYDRIGLLYDITRTLSALGIDIVLSKISTKADQVADVFYLRDRDGKKILAAERQEEIRGALLEAIGS